MRRRLMLTGIVLALAAGAVGPADAATLHTSQIIGFSYAPDPLSVEVGDSVQWLNVAPNADHTATVQPSATNPFAFDSGLISPGNTSPAVLMTTPGSYTVLCTFHGTSMRQQLIVSAVPGPVVPEVPLPALLGLTGLAMLGAAIAVDRRRTIRQA